MLERLCAFRAQDKAVRESYTIRDRGHPTCGSIRVSGIEIERGRAELQRDHTGLAFQCENFLGELPSEGNVCILTKLQAHNMH
jgi:hypothetical protein